MALSNRSDDSLLIVYSYLIIYDTNLLNHLIVHGTQPVYNQTPVLHGTGVEIGRRKMIYSFRMYSLIFFNLVRLNIFKLTL